MKSYFAYIRVSTPKQGKGVSLEEQQSAIKAHAERRGIVVVEWFEEKETAAKTGRAVFSKMLARLEHGEAEGVIIHKIDRSARNLWDWANLSKLFDRGIDVQFAHDSVDLRSRGGRLSADIMAIVAADYIRNLREEVKKGFYGRLKQGIYPLPAPIGYLDRGQGNPKAIDPHRAPFVQLAFIRYATGTVGLKDLCKELRDRGLRTRVGKPVSFTSLSLILNNPFYVGLIRIRKTDETFEGKHPPLVNKSVFDRVQAILRGKTVSRVFKHDLLFRRLVRCDSCGLNLIGERQKGHVYYRCHQCRGIVTREEALDDIVQSHLKLIAGDDREIGEVGDLVEEERRSGELQVGRLKEAVKALLAKCEDRLNRLTDALIDQLIDKATFEARKRALLGEKKSLEDRLACASAVDLPRHRAFKYLELGNAAYSGYISADSFERRRIIARFSSNLYISGKSVGIALQSPYREIVNWRKSQNGAPYYCTPRTRAKELLAIIEAHEPASDFVSVHDSETEVQQPNGRFGMRAATKSPTSPTSLSGGSRPPSTRRPSISRVGRKAELPQKKRRVSGN
jgi:site-specific DNA recombinase